MSRSLHWALILGCLGLVVLYAQPAWDALSTGVPESALAAVSTPPGSERGELAVVGSVPAPELEALGASRLAVAEKH